MKHLLLGLLVIYSTLTHADDLLKMCNDINASACMQIASSLQKEGDNQNASRYFVKSCNYGNLDLCKKLSSHVFVYLGDLNGKQLIKNDFPITYIIAKGHSINGMDCKKESIEEREENLFYEKYSCTSNGKTLHYHVVFSKNLMKPIKAPNQKKYKSLIYFKENGKTHLYGYISQ